MNCPNCKTKLESKTYKEIPVESCPKCGELMKGFNYRWEDLELEYCEANHGFWPLYKK